MCFPPSKELSEPRTMPKGSIHASTNVNDAIMYDLQNFYTSYTRKQPSSLLKQLYYPKVSLKEKKIQQKLSNNKFFQTGRHTKALKKYKQRLRFIYSMLTNLHDLIFLSFSYCSLLG
jgi:hypothetical protein